MEVHEAGGGINFTVERTKAASEEELLGLLMRRLRRMLSAGEYYDLRLIYFVEYKMARSFSFNSCLLLASLTFLTPLKTFKKIQVCVSLKTFSVF